MGVLTVRTLLMQAFGYVDRVVSTKLRQTCRERFAHLFSSLFLGAASLLRYAMALGMCMSPGGQQRVGLFPLLCRFACICGGNLCREALQKSSHNTHPHLLEASLGLRPSPGMWYSVRT